MEYIYDFCESNERYKQCLDFSKDLQALDDATSVDIAVLRANVAGLGAKLRRIKSRIDDKQTITRSGDNFAKIMQPFYMNSISKYEKLQKSRDAMFKELKDLAVWLNEPNDANFKYLKSFE
eukprot:TRINITY_DN30209_c0_g1_i1.p1 TRINITY_DN30209_c0_g1~~TRINITY_DN30209_c0_g1_i1.p1  ORF type:complete len:121 (+),score=17.88 TRINITY_DN30209_c0_g1_i1:37-399(+)